MNKKWVCVVLVLAFVFGGINFVSKGTEATKAAAAGSDELPFKDISSHWAKDNILKAYESGLVDGFPDGTFRPDDVVQADQFIVMMLRAFSITENGVTQFDPAWLDELRKVQPSFMLTIVSEVRKANFDFQPAKTGYWAKPFVDFLYEIPYLYSSDLVFKKEYKRYEMQLKREEANYLLGSWYASFEGSINGLYEELILSNSGLKDYNTFSNNIGTYRATVLMAGLMNGYPNNYFYPNRYVTRAEALTMAQRLRDKSLRTPYQPDLRGQYYTEIDGSIYLFSDKYKYDTYHKLIELGREYVTTGYFDVSSGSTMDVFDSHDEYEKHQFLTRMGMYNERPTQEIIVGVNAGTHREVFVSYLRNKKMPHSSAYFEAVLELYAGEGKGKELHTLLIAYEKELYNSTKFFKFNNKEFELYKNGDYYVLEMSY